LSWRKRKKLTALGAERMGRKKKKDARPPQPKKTEGEVVRSFGEKKKKKEGKRGTRSSSREKRGLMLAGRGGEALGEGRGKEENSKTWAEKKKTVHHRGQTNREKK